MELNEKIRCIIIDTGNIMKLKEMQRKTTQTPTDELVESAEYALKEWMKSDVSTSTKNEKKTDVLECVNRNNDFLEDRQNLKLTVKVFLYDTKTSALEDAVNNTLTHLGVTMVDSLILALGTTQPTLSRIQPLWEILQDMVKKESIVTIGFSDLDTSQLCDLYEWAMIKPSTNQVNLESCCVMPPEMIAFAKEKDIQLLTHNDPKDILPEEMVKKLLKDVKTESVVWAIQWVVRYSVIVKGRGIIQSKGFILCLNKMEGHQNNV